MLADTTDHRAEQLFGVKASSEVRAMQVWPTSYLEVGHGIQHSLPSQQQELAIGDGLHASNLHTSFGPQQLT